MEITRNDRADCCEIKLNGRLDAAWSEHVSQAVAGCVRDGQHAIALDMAEVNYLSSAGIRVLMLYARQLKNIQGRFAIINASAPVRKVLVLSGLESLMQAAAPPAPAAPAAGGGGARKVELPQAGALAEVFTLDPAAVLRVHWPGNPEAWLAGGPPPAAGAITEFAGGVMGLGLGVLPSGATGDAECPGEFLAAAGAAVCLPADGANQPDYLVQQGALIPAVKVAYGMLGQGAFSQLLRFDQGPGRHGLPLSDVIRASLEAAGGGAAGMVLVAETASLVGAALRQTPPAPPPGSSPPGLFEFPGVRDWLSFTAEPAFANSTCLIVGFAATGARGPGLKLLRPLVPSGEIHGHFHAAAFPYRPLRKGRVDLAETVQFLFQAGTVTGLLHLLHDWRQHNGAGESRLLRGACWCAPLEI